jgi:electron transport complex protein RnfE
MMRTKTMAQEFVKGLWDDNPVFRQLLGLCPTLAVTGAVINGLAMGLATTFVLIFSSLVVSSIKKLIPSQVRIASYIVIIATFVTVADRFLAAFFPPISKSLGPYVPLIVVNCIILGRQEAFSSRNSVGRSLIDALGMSSGFVLALLILSAIREILGAGTFLGYQVMGAWFEPWIIMILPPGAFITLGIILAIALQIERRARLRK